MIDPVTVEARKRAVRPRGKGPHHVWHMDGWHKLILFGIVLHGIVDGFLQHAYYGLCVFGKQRRR